MLGDHIRALKGGRWLHGIDLGDQRILYLQEDPALAPGDRLRRVYRPEFTAGASRVELVVHRERAYPAKAVVARAWSRFMDPSVVAMFRDSEQFAAWCKIGRVPEGTQPSATVAPPPAAAAPVAAGPAAEVRSRPAPRTKGAPRKAAPAKAKAGGKKAPPKAAAPRKAGGKKASPKAVAPKRAATKRSGKKKAPPRRAAPAKPKAKAGKKKGRR